MYALSFHCVDRTFLLISRDPACIKVGNMPFLLVVQYCDRGTHLLILRVQYSRTITGIDGFYHFMKISKQFALASCFGGQDDSYTRTITRRCHRRSQLLFDEEKCSFLPLLKRNCNRKSTVYRTFWALLLDYRHSRCSSGYF